MKKPLNVTVDEDLLAELDRRRGLRSKSSVVQRLLERAILDEDLTFLPPSLKDTKVAHNATRHPQTRVWHLAGSVVYPRDDAPGGPVPYPVRHDLELKGGADEWKPGRHWFNPAKCAFCRLVLRDFPG